jgi:hypothetical protein
MIKAYIPQEKEIAFFSINDNLFIVLIIALIFLFIYGLLDLFFEYLKWRKAQESKKTE